MFKTEHRVSYHIFFNTHIFEQLQLKLQIFFNAVNYVWDDEVLDIDCPDNHHISIVYAHYGFGICNYAGSRDSMKERYIVENLTTAIN